MKVIDIINIIEKTAPLSAAAPWDASGVQVASVRDEASLLAVLLDPTLANVERALAEGADFILAHHPLSLQPRFPNKADDYLAVLSLLCGNKTWLYSAHTSLDANPSGPAHWLAHALELTGVSILEPCPGGPEAEFGFGFAGALPAPLDYAEFCRRLGRAIGKNEWQVCGARPETVVRVACCPGSGSSLLQQALGAGADVFITGDVKYHSALDAQGAGLRVLDVGHFCIEEEMMLRFASRLQDELDIPVHFFPGRDPLEAERL